MKKDLPRMAHSTPPLDSCAASSLTEFEYGRQEAALDPRVHEHQGVWWRRIAPFYCRPAFEFQRLQVGLARPRRAQSWLGYGHAVANSAEANRWLECMVLQGENLSEFSLDRLPSSKRTRVRKGLRSVEVRLLADIEAVVAQLFDVGVSQAARVHQKSGFGGGTDELKGQEEKWCSRQVHLHRLGGRDWWAALYDGRVVAYVLSEQVGDTLSLPVVRSHSDFLHLCPVDALYFNILSRANTARSCSRVIDGAVHHESLNRFKMQFLFKPTPLPYYATRLWLRRWGMLAFRLRERMRRGAPEHAANKPEASGSRRAAPPEVGDG